MLICNVVVFAPTRCALDWYFSSEREELRSSAKCDGLRSQLNNVSTSSGLALKTALCNYTNKTRIKQCYKIYKNTLLYSPCDAMRTEAINILFKSVWESMLRIRWKSICPSKSVKYVCHYYIYVKWIDEWAKEYWILTTETDIEILLICRHHSEGLVALCSSLIYGNLLVFTSFFLMIATAARLLKLIPFGVFFINNIWRQIDWKKSKIK